MAETKISTRDRILDTCRLMFNERGPNKVTTAEIAESVGISEGNLHYHFQRKDQIVEALFDQFVIALAQAGGNPDHSTSRHTQYLEGWFETMWEWRLFYTAVTYHFAPSLQPRLAELTRTGQEQVRRMLDALVRDGLLHATPADLDALVVNAWIIAGSWIDYVGARQGAATVTREHLRAGKAQVEALFTPFAAAAPALTMAREA